MSRMACFLLFSFLWTPLAQGQSEADIEKRIESLIALVGEAKFDQAVAEVTEMVNLYPYSFDAHMAGFQVHFAAFQYQPGGPGSSGHLEEALKRLDFSRRLQPLNYQAWELALSFWNPSRLSPDPPGQEAQKLLSQAADALESGQTDQASQLLREVISLEEDYTPAYIHLGELYLGQGQADQALRVARTASRKDPRDPAIFFLMARSYALSERGQESLDNIIRALRADPSYPPAWEMLMQLDLGGGNHAQHMGVHFPKEVLWLIDQEIEEPSEADLEGVNPPAKPAWRAYITSRVRWRKVGFQKRNPDFQVYKYSFREELNAVTDTVLIWEEVKATHPEVEDPLLDHWMAASKVGALEAAVFVDLFLEEFRQDFTGWKQQNNSKFEEYFYKFLLPRVAKLNSSRSG